jgi:16S rRNA (guanine527-N7)-methyltransferase
MIEQLRHYFPSLTSRQEEQFIALGDLYPDWNSKINVISRKDIENLYERHILHSLVIDKVLHFKQGTKVLDFGTGGGFPGIPLAILLPDVQFCLIDSIGKKIRVATEISNAIDLKNVILKHIRGEEETERFDFVVSRAVMPLSELVRVVRKNIVQQQHNALPNGIISLKGGEISSEIAPFKNKATAYSLSDYFTESFFATKKAIYLPL